MKGFALVTVITVRNGKSSTSHWGRNVRFFSSGWMVISNLPWQ